MSETVQVFDGVAVVAAGDVFIMAWRSAARLERTKWALGLAERLLEAHPNGITILTIALPTSSPPDKATRDALSEFVQRHTPKLRRIVTVAAGDALWGSIVRTVLRALFVVTGQSQLQAVTGTEHEGIDLIRQSGSAATPSHEALLSRVQELFDALQVQRGADASAV
jgi:hypothetical protein